MVEKDKGSVGKQLPKPFDIQMCAWKASSKLSLSENKINCP